jgi:hypothetical protein
MLFWYQPLFPAHNSSDVLIVGSTFRIKNTPKVNVSLKQGAVFWKWKSNKLCLCETKTEPSVLTPVLLIQIRTYSINNKESQPKFEINKILEVPRWRLEGRSRQRKLRKWKTLLKCWSQTKKHQEESKFLYPEPPAYTKLLHATLHWENRRAPTPPDACSKPAWQTQTNRWANKRHAVFPQLPLG